jgi:para-nitrobenzyl esterase
VTIAGESAGGMSVGSLLGSPLARGLFRGAIAQSGAAQHTIGERDAAAVGRALVARLGVHDLEGLRALPVDALLDAQVEVEEMSIRGEIPGLEDDRRGLAGMIFRPVVGGRSLPSPPLDAIRAGLSRDVSVLVGTNLHETTLFHPGPTDDDKLRRLTGHHLGKERVDETLATYRAEHPDASPHDLLVALTTDWAFRIPAVRLAEAQHAAGGRAWQYLFTWESRGFGGHLRSTHALEIPFAWNTLDAPGVGAFLGEGVQPQGLAEAMHRSWIEFVHEGAVGWPAFDPERRPVMEFGDEVGLRHDPYGATRRLFDGVR